MGCISSIPRNAAHHFRRRVNNVVDSPQEQSTAAVGVRQKPSRGSRKKVTTILSSDAMAGDKIREKYKIGKELGRGEFGVTYQCMEIETGTHYACKTISKSNLRTGVDVEDVRREVEIMRRLPSHPNIVAFKEAFEDKEAVYLVMELCHGGELFDRIVARGHYTERDAAQVVRSMIQVVKVCHEHGVMHRDLKPENFLFSDKGHGASLKAIDFGLSMFFVPGQRFKEVVGSPYYMAPELLKRRYGPEIDVWSVGVILYILLCGVPPFWAANDEGIAHAIVRGVIDFERDPWPRISKEAKHLVRRMLDQNPRNRLSVDEALEHPWMKNVDNVANVSLGEIVRARIKQFSLMNKFKKQVLRVVAHSLPDDQQDKLRTAFHMMDTDKNGCLSFEELKQGLCNLGHTLPDTDVQLILEAADVDGNGTLDCAEFITLSIHLQRMAGEDYLKNAFKYFDKNNNGYIEIHELREALASTDISATSENVIHDILSDADLDKDGQISYEEFRAMMNSGMDWKMSSRQYSKAMFNKLSFKLFKDNSLKVK